MEARALFEALLHAESEDDALAVLQASGYLADDRVWRQLGDMENNFSIVGNQHSDPTGALVEKVVNSIDAVLMAGCYRAGIEPEGPEAPQSMTEAVEQFFGVKEGRLGRVDSAKELTKLAEAIQLVAVGSKENRSYLVIDLGEGQTPDNFPKTFMSPALSNKLRTPFVRGRFNSGGTGVLQFCGTQNLQLVASRRAPEAPAAAEDDSADLWGFTVVRRIEPAAHERRKNSIYVYLAPDGRVPRFKADAVMALPGETKGKRAPEPYAAPLTHGSIIKLYNYQWSARSIATTEARFELEKYLHAPCLPFRISETRSGYSANYYKTTVAGVWAAIESAAADPDNPRVEQGFPFQATLPLAGIGTLTYRVAVFAPEVKPRRIPKGVFFDVAGQAQGSLPADFISRRLGFEFLRNHMLVSVDCSNMLTRARDDLFMASRDRLRRNPVYDQVTEELERYLKVHPGLRALNAARLNKAIEKGLSSEEDIVSTLNQLLKQDPGLRRLFNLGDRLVSTVGPTETKPFVGQRFPTYFRLAQGGESLNKTCPVNRTVRIEFLTDAANDYFERADSPGWFALAPDGALAHESLWNGVWRVSLKAPPSAKVGDQVTVKVAVSDLEREGTGRGPYEATVKLTIVKEEIGDKPPGPKPPRPGPGPKKKQQPELGLPEVFEVRKDNWEDYDPVFTSLEAMRVIKNPETDGYLYVLNLDNSYLLTDLRSLGENDKALATYWFKWGLLLCALGTMQHQVRLKEAADGAEPNGALDPLDATNIVLGGVSTVIIPVIRNLYRGPNSS
jgi:hypothetical protein